jgi:hypothetical protein
VLRQIGAGIVLLFVLVDMLHQGMKRERQAEYGEAGKNDRPADLNPSPGRQCDWPHDG